jgi:hypothetical protein
MPIEGGGACDDICVRQDLGVAVGRKILARLKQQDAAWRIGAQSRRKDRASRTAAYNNDVEGLFGSPLCPGPVHPIIPAASVRIQRTRLIPP